MKIYSKWLCLTFGLCSITILPKTRAQDPLTTLYQWGNLEYDYPNESERQHAIDSGEFVPENGAPIDVDMYYSAGNHHKVFVSIPRFQNGIPATFGTITNRVHNGNPIIAPFPAWSWHRNSEACARDRLVSVFRFKIDECQRLWLLDTGRIGSHQLCPPQILAFDLKTNNLIHRYEIPKDQLESTSILVTPIVDVRNPHEGCYDTFVYAADCQAFALIVHDAQKGTSWKIVDKTMYPNPFFGNYNFAGYTFDLMDGVLGMDLSPYVPGKDRILYYHALSSGSEQWVYTSHLRNQSMFVDNPSPAPEIFHVYPGQRHTQSAAMAIDKNGIAYFGLVSDLSMNCWNTGTEYGPSNIGQIARDPVRLQFPSGVKVITNKAGKQELWFVTMRFQRMATGTLDTTDKNFRIMVGKIDDFSKGSRCVGRPSSHHHNHYGLYGSSHSHSHGGGYGYDRTSKKSESLQFPSD
ncbi:hypothetical protein RN001_014043 [Aquatica leii]|uniref:Bee-milk protein n=1 Tax=Aquatica leii TaxID=1421715 RepID=A0AAN7QDM5_9COLE|nr:hypothetical protein RN001_014043 [Aquatica leii]